MTVSKLLVANRGEIAIRVMRAAAELDIATVAIFSEDDAQSLRVRRAGEAHPLNGIGAAPYLDIEQIVAAAGECHCDAIHPGYGFLSENAALATACADAGLAFVGPSAEALQLFGDKVRARALAEQQGIPVPPGSAHAVSLEEAQDFYAALGDGGRMVIKAVGGGGGRGMRVVAAADEIADAYARAASEAGAAFSNDALYVERFIERARHLEVQVIGDTTGAVSALGERECSVQRRHQKLVEIAPGPSLSVRLREEIVDAAVRVAKAAGYHSLGTIEFLLDEESQGDFAFIEANARLQVEHTVTEEVHGVDLVQAQLRIAGGATLAELGLSHAPLARGYAIQARVNLERMEPDGNVRPTGGMLTLYEPPAGPGVRVDGYGYAGYATNANFDSLLAKVIVHSSSDDFRDAVKRCQRALAEFEIGGVETNLPFLRNVVAHEDFSQGLIYTRWLDDHIAELATLADSSPGAPESGAGQAGANVDLRDPLAALEFYRQGQGTRPGGAAPKIEVVGPPNTKPLGAPLQGTVTEILVAEGDAVREGQLLFVMSALKMEHLVKAEIGGVVRRVTVAVGDTVYEEHPLAFIEAMDVGEAIVDAAADLDLDYIRPDLQAVFDRRAFTLDENRPEAVERRHSKGRLTVRENISQLIDEGTWTEYAPLAIAGQRRKRSLQARPRRMASSPASAPSTATSSTSAAPARCSSPTTTRSSPAHKALWDMPRPTA